MKNRLWLLLAVLVLAVSLPARAAVHLWTGAASGLFSDAANWRGGSPAGDPAAELSFPAGAIRLGVTNDLSGLTVRTIAFSGAGYTIGGQGLSLVSGAEIIDSTMGPNALGCDLQLAGGVSIFNAGSIYEAAALTLSGVIGGTGPVIKTGKGRATFTGTRANTYSGRTEVLNGELRLGKSNGVDAVPGDLLLGSTGVNDEYGYVTTVADEQIPNTATIRAGNSNQLGVGGTETVGPLELSGSARLGTAITFSGVSTSLGTLILAGDITLTPSEGSNSTTIGGDVALLGSRTVTMCATCNAISLENVRDYTPGAGLTIRGASLRSGRVDIYRSTYHGPTVIDGATVSVNNPNTAVQLRDGYFSGTVASLVAERGIVEATRFSRTSTTGDLRLSAWTELRLGFEGLHVGGTFDAGRATVLLGYGSNQGARGASYTVVMNDGPNPIRGTFAGAPEGAITGNFRISYRGGDGNDIVVTDVGRRESRLFLSADPSFLQEGQSVRLVASVSAIGSTDSPAGGQVIFQENGTVLGAATVTAGGEASITIQPSFGSHTYTATFRGTGELLPASSTANVRVSPLAAILTAIEPAAVPGGVPVTLVLRGTGFLPDSYLSMDSSLIPLKFVSSTELQLTWTFPRTDADRTTTVRQQQSGINSNSLPFVITGNRVPPTILTFEPRAITGPVVPGGGAAWMSQARYPRPSGSILELRTAVTPDADRDGVARWEQPEDLPSTGLWLMTDLTDGKISSGTPGPDRSAPLPLPFPSAIFLRNAEGRYSHIIYPGGAWKLMLVRPGAGAWELSGGDGAGIDLDGSFNGYWVLETSQLRPVGNSPVTPPAGVEPGDSLVAIQEGSGGWTGDRVDAHLHESDGPGTLVFSPPGGLLTVKETAGVLRVTVLRVKGTDGTVSVNYTTADKGATAGQQYTGTAGRLTFGPGEILKTIEVPITNDTSYSESSTFQIVLSDPAGTTITGPTTLNFTIQDDDPAPTLSIAAPATVAEGEGGRRDVNVVVTLTGSNRFPVTARWFSSIDDPSVPGESGTLTFLPGGPATQILTLHFDANRIPNLDRGLRVTLADITNAMPDRLDGFITVIDDDLPDLTIADVTVSETQSSVRVVISSMQASPKPVTVRYNTTSGSATAGSDFTATSGVATFNRTASGYFVDIPILADTTAEGDETFSLVLADATNARIRRSAATIVILDDETPVLPSIVAASVTVSENVDSVARFRIALSFPSTHEVRFRAMTAGGTATAGADFVPLDQMFVIPAGATEIFVPVTLLDDIAHEGPETFALTLSEGVGATIATPALTATIFDSDFVAGDPNAVMVAAENIQLPEGNAGSTAARFTVRLSRAASEAVVVSYSTADGSAVAPADYTPVAGTLTFAPGETVKSVDVLVHGDIEYESDESFTLVMIAPTGKVTSATCRIIDGDLPVDRRRSAGH